MHYVAGLLIIFIIAGCVYTLFSAFKDLSDSTPKPNSKVRKVFTPGAVIKTYYNNNELDMIYTVIGTNKVTLWLDLSYYSPYSGKYLGQTQRLITGLMDEERCEVYRDGLLVAVFERGKEPIFYGLNFKKKIKINIPELNEKHA